MISISIGLIYIVTRQTGFFSSHQQNKWQYFLEMRIKEKKKNLDERWNE